MTPRAPGPPSGHFLGRQPCEVVSSSTRRHDRRPAALDAVRKRAGARGCTAWWDGLRPRRPQDSEVSLRGQRTGRVRRKRLGTKRNLPDHHPPACVQLRGRRRFETCDEEGVNHTSEMTLGLLTAPKFGCRQRPTVSVSISAEAGGSTVLQVLKQNLSPSDRFVTRSLGPKSVCFNLLTIGSAVWAVRCAAFLHDRPRASVHPSTGAKVGRVRLLRTCALGAPPSAALLPPSFRYPWSTTVQKYSAENSRSKF